MKPFKRSAEPEIDPQLAAHLNLLRLVPERDPQAAALGRSNFLDLAAQLPTPVSHEPERRPKGWIFPIFPKERLKMIPTLTSILVLLSLIFGGAGVTAYAAQESQPDEPLYALKTLTEDFRLSLADSTQEELALQLKFLERRYMELNYMLRGDKALPQAFQERLQAEMQTGLQLAASLSDPDMQRVLLQYRDMLRAQDRVMEQMQGQANTPQQDQLRQQIQEQIRQQIQYCDEGLQEPQLLRNRLMQSGNGNAEPPAIIPEPGPVLTQPPGQNQPGPQPESPGKQSGGAPGPLSVPSSSPESENRPAEITPGSDPGPGPESGPGPAENPAPQPGTGSGPNGGGNGSPSDGGGGGNSGGGGGK
jgi:hypothetical protein